MKTLIAITLMALTIIGEARTQPIEGQMCLAWTIRNRMLSSGWTAEEVVFQKNQYSLWEPGVVAKGYRLRRQWLTCFASGHFPDNPWCMEPLLTIGDEAYWWKVFNTAAGVYFGQAPPPGCEGVTNYDNPDFWLHNGGQPPWAKDMEFAVCYGDHCFWRPKTE